MAQSKVHFRFHNNESKNLKCDSRNGKRAIGQAMSTLSEEQCYDIDSVTFITSDQKTHGYDTTKKEGEE